MSSLICRSCLLSLISASAAPAVSNYLQISPTPQVCVAHTSHPVAPAILVYHKVVDSTGIRTLDTRRVISKSESCTTELWLELKAEATWDKLNFSVANLSVWFYLNALIRPEPYHTPRAKVLAVPVNHMWILCSYIGKGASDATLVHVALLS